MRSRAETGGVGRERDGQAQGEGRHPTKTLDGSSEGEQDRGVWLAGSHPRHSAPQPTTLLLRRAAWPYRNGPGGRPLRSRAMHHPRAQCQNLFPAMSLPAELRKAVWP